MVGVEPDVVAFPPGPGLPGDLVVHDELVVPVHPESGHVQVHRRLAGAVRVDVDHDDDGVVAGGLAEDHDRVVVGRVHGQVAQLLERGVGAADLVEPGEVRR